MDGTNFRDLQAQIVNTTKDPFWLIHKFKHVNIWKDSSITDHAKHFIFKLLAPVEEKRITIKQAMEHPWIQAVHATHTPTTTDIDDERAFESTNNDDGDLSMEKQVQKTSLLESTDSLSSSAATSDTTDEAAIDSVAGSQREEQQWQQQQRLIQQIKAIDTIIQSYQFIQQECQHIADVFTASSSFRLFNDKYEYNNECTMTREQVRQAYELLFGATLLETDLDNVFAKLYYYHPNAADTVTISGMDFLVAALNEKEILFTPALRQAFDVLDSNDSGLISADQLARFLRKYVTLFSSKQERLDTRRVTIATSLLKKFEDNDNDNDDDFCNVVDIALEELVAILFKLAVSEHRTSSKFSNTDLMADPADEQKLSLSNSSSAINSPNSLTSLTTTTTSRRQSSLYDRLNLKFSSKEITPRTPQTINHYYEITDFANEGSCGAVFFCTHKQSGCERAVKLVRKDLHDETYNKQILEEFFILRKLDHPVRENGNMFSPWLLVV